jgi:hypothetical protein
VVINHAKYMSSPFAFIEFANSKDDDKWLDISKVILNILQNTKFINQSLIEVDFTKKIKNKEYKVLYCCLIKWIFSNIIKKPAPKWTNKKILFLKKPWSPYDFENTNIKNCNTFFSKHNVLIPNGEFQWI